MGTNKFAEMLKYYLMMNNKTQSDLVNDLGFDKSTVSNWCAGLRVPKVDVIIDIANYLPAKTASAYCKKCARAAFTRRCS